MAKQTYFGICFCEQNKTVNYSTLFEIISDKFEIMKNGKYVDGKFNDIDDSQPTTFRYRIRDFLIPTMCCESYDIIDDRYYMTISYKTKESLDEELLDCIDNEKFTHSEDPCIMFGTPDGMHHMFYLVSYNKNDELNERPKEINDIAFENFYNLWETHADYTGYCKLGYRWA